MKEAEIEEEGRVDRNNRGKNIIWKFGIMTLHPETAKSQHT
jgi:hypothetical protein